AACERARADHPQDFGMLVHELLRESDRLLAHLRPIAGDPVGVHVVRERDTVEKDRPEAHREAQDQIEVVEDVERPVEWSRRLHAPSRETHALELAEVPAKHLGDTHRPAGGHATPRPRGSGCAPRRRAVSSVEPSSTTTTSRSTPVSASRLARLAPSTCARLKVGTTTETSGTALTAVPPLRRRTPRRRR